VVALRLCRSDGKLDVKNVGNQIACCRSRALVDKGFAADAIIAKEYVKRIGSASDPGRHPSSAR